MSTILKALRRIEEDKAQGVRRPLREDVVLVPPTRRRVAPSVLVAVAAVAFATTVAVLSALRERGAVREEVIAAAPLQPAARLRGPEPVAAAPPPAVAAPVAAPAAAPVPEVPSPARGAEALAAPPAPAPEFDPAPPEVVVLHPKPPAPTPMRSEEAPSTEAIAAPAKPKRAAAAAASPRVLRTSWHPTSEKRVAWVQVPGGGTTPVHEGDRVGSYVVREIEPAAVVFDDGAAEIRRNVGAR